jgi:hypothetical protein
VLEWRVDDQVVARGEATAAIDWPLIPGRHTIQVRDGKGRATGVAITVK